MWTCSAPLRGTRSAAQLHRTIEGAGLGAQTSRARAPGPGVTGRGLQPRAPVGAEGRCPAGGGRPGRARRHRRGLRGAAAAGSGFGDGLAGGDGFGADPNVARRPAGAGAGCRRAGDAAGRYPWPAPPIEGSQNPESLAPRAARGDDTGDHLPLGGITTGDDGVRHRGTGRDGSDAANSENWPRRPAWRCCAASPSTVQPLPPMTLRAVGVGAGGRDVPGRPNVVRVLVGERT